MKQKMIKKATALMLAFALVCSMIGTLPIKVASAAGEDDFPVTVDVYAETTNPGTSTEPGEGPGEGDDTPSIADLVDGKLTETTNQVELASEGSDGDTKVYEFVPTKTAMYFIYSNTIGADLDANLYDDQGELIANNEDADPDEVDGDYPLNGETLNFFIAQELTKDTKYYVEIMNFGDAGTFDIVCSTEFNGIIDDTDIGGDEDIEGFDIQALVDGNPVDSDDELVGYRKGENIVLSAKVTSTEDNKELDKSQYSVKWFKESEDGDDKTLVSSDYTYEFKKAAIEEYFYCSVTVGDKTKVIEVNFAATDSVSVNASATDASGNALPIEIEADDDYKETDVTVKAENGNDITLKAGASSKLENPEYTFTWYTEDEETEEIEELQVNSYNTKTATDSFTLHKTEIEEEYYCDVSDGNSIWTINFYLESNTKVAYTSSWKINGQESMEEVVTAADEVEMIVDAKNPDGTTANVEYEWYYQEEYELSGMTERDGKTYYYDGTDGDIENIDTEDLELMPFKLISCEDGTLKVSGIIDESNFTCELFDEEGLFTEIPFTFYPTTEMNISSDVKNDTQNTSGNKNEIGDMMKLSVNPTLDGEDISDKCTYQWYYYDSEDEEYYKLEGETGATYEYQILEQKEIYKCMVAQKDGSERLPMIFTVIANPTVKYSVAGKINDKAASEITAEYKEKVNLSVDISAPVDTSHFCLRWYDQNGKLIANSADKQAVQVEVTKDMNYYCMIYYGNKISDDKYPKRVDFSVKLKVAGADDSQCQHKNVEVVDVVKATCSKAGYTGNKHCKDCDKIIEKGTEIKIVAHTWDAGAVTTQPTAVMAGTKTYTCSVCHATKKETIPAKGLPAAGTQMTSGGAKYKVLSADASNPTVEYVKPSSAKATVTIPDTVTVDGAKYKVVSIAAKAFKKNKKLTKVTIGTNIKKIGKEAFYGCKKLKTVNVKTKSLGKKSIGKNAFKGIHKKAVVKVPKKQLKNYKKYFKKAGIKGKTQKIKK